MHISVFFFYFSKSILLRFCTSHFPTFLRTLCTEPEHFKPLPQFHRQPPLHHHTCRPQTSQQSGRERFVFFIKLHQETFGLTHQTRIYVNILGKVPVLLLIVKTSIFLHTFNNLRMNPSLKNVLND